MKALSITTAGTVTHFEITSGESLSQMQGAVGGYIEILALTPSLSLVIDEEGKFKSYSENTIGTRLTQHFGVGLMPGDCIVGNVLLIGNNDDGETIDVPTEAEDVLSRLGFPTTTKA